MNENQDALDDIQISRVVHFVIPSGKCRPAIVVEDWPGSGKPGYVNLAVVTDGTNDGIYGQDDHTHQIQTTSGLMASGKANLPLMLGWETSVLPNHAVRAVRSWHWGRECSKLHQPLAPFTDENKETWHHNHVDGMRDPHNCSGCIAQARYIKENIPT